MGSKLFYRWRDTIWYLQFCTLSGAACASLLPLPNRFAKPHTLRYNQAKGKRSYLAWLRTGDSAGNAYFAYSVFGNGSGNGTFPARLLAVRPALHIFTPPNRFAKPHTLRYNRAKGKRLLFAWLRSGPTRNAYSDSCLTGNGCSDYAYASHLLAVRPALHFYHCQTDLQNLILCGIIKQRVKDLILLGCVTAVAILHIALVVFQVGAVIAMLFLLDS